MKPIYILGGGWVSSTGFGFLRNGRKSPEFTSYPAILPNIKDFVKNPSTRYGRFDLYTAQGYICAALALRDSGIPEERDSVLDIGILVSSRFDCFSTDMAFYETTVENDGEFASPQLFSYTLPGIVMGEIAVTFKLCGPTLSFGETEQEPGTAALKYARIILEDGMCDTLLTGWNDAPPEVFRQESFYLHGACFTVLSLKNDPEGKAGKLGSEKVSLPALFGRK